MRGEKKFPAVVFLEAFQFRAGLAYIQTLSVPSEGNTSNTGKNNVLNETRSESGT